MTRSSATLAWLCSAFLACAASAAAERPHLVPDDLYRVVDVSDPQVSPDGAWVAYVAGANDREADEARAAIWMVSWDGSQRLALSTPVESTSKPRWSPDGKFLAFLSDPAGSDHVQIMLLDRRGGEARAVSHESGSIEDFAWAPDGRRIVLVADEADAPTPKPLVIEALHFKQDSGGYLTPARLRHLRLLDVATAQSEPLTSGTDCNDEQAAWSPDGRQIVFTRTHERGADPDGREDIDVIDAAAGAKPRTVARVFAPNAQRLAFSPDGTLLAFLQGIEPKYNAYMQDRLFIVPASGGKPRALSDKLDRAVTSYAFAGDSASIRVLVEDDLGAYAAHIDLKSGEIARETAPGAFTVSNLSSAGDHAAVLETTDSMQAEVHALENGKLRKLTAHNEWLDGIELGTVDEIRFKNKEGTDVHGLMVKPPGYQAGHRYPLVLWIHGGPNGGDQHALSLDGYQFEHQMFAAKGYVVLRVNYRGGSGRGLAYAKTIVADWGHKEVIDLLAGVDHAVALGIADPDRLAIGGWSYGGILTDYTIATDRRFKVAISGAGSANQLSTYGVDEYVLQYDHELGPPWKDTALWLKVSYPFFHADRIHTPTLFLGGSKDFNVPIVGGEQMYQALRSLGVPAELVVYPGEHHVFARPSFVKDLADRMSAWLDRFIPPSTSAN